MFDFTTIKWYSLITIQMRYIFFGPYGQRMRAEGLVCLFSFKTVLQITKAHCLEF